MEGPETNGEIVFHTHFLEWVEQTCPTSAERVQVMASMVRLLDAPAGKHGMGGTGVRLRGWNTKGLNGDNDRVIFRSAVHHDGSPDPQVTVEVLSAGPRAGNEAYWTADQHLHGGYYAALADNLLTNDEVSDLHEALELIDVCAADLGIHWDDVAPAAPPEEGLVRRVVASGALDEETATLLSTDELKAYEERFWSDQDVDAALDETLNVDPGGGRAVLASREGPRCGRWMPIAKQPCRRSAKHRGPCRKE